MAEATAEKKKRGFTCPKCGQAFKGGRALGTHYSENPTHRPAKPAKKRGRKGGRRKAAAVALGGGSGAAIKAALAAIDGEIEKLQKARAALVAAMA